MSQNCPVCKKSGLPDYKIQEVTCPQCNSNLRAYLLLSNISKPSTEQSKTFLPISIVVLAISLLVIFYWNKFEENQTEIPATVEQITSTKMDSSNYYKSLIATLKDSISKVKTIGSIEIEYKIKKGDCLSKIADNFFGDWSKYQKIEIDNNLVKPYKLTQGQIIKIKMDSK
jgi:hypothetical protein